MTIFLLACLWTSEKRFGDTGSDDGRIIYHSVLNQPEDLLAMPGRIFVTSRDQKVRVFDVARRDAPILENTIELETEPKGIFNYGDRLFVATTLGLEVRDLNTLAITHKWDTTDPIIDAAWRPGGTSAVLALRTSPPTIIEIEFGNGTLIPTKEWPIELSPTIQRIACSPDGVAFTTEDGALHHIDLNSGALVTEPSISPTDIFDVHVTDSQFILHATGDNGLKSYDSQLDLRSNWPPLGEARAVHSLDTTVYMASSEQLSILSMDQAGVLTEIMVISLNRTEKPTNVVVDRGFAYLIDSERGFFSIVDVLR